MSLLVPISSSVFVRLSARNLGVGGQLADLVAAPSPPPAARGPPPPRAPDKVLQRAGARIRRFRLPRRPWARFRSAFAAPMKSFSSRDRLRSANSSAATCTITRIDAHNRAPTILVNEMKFDGFENAIRMLVRSSAGS
jgi:hypothetical protein